MADIVTVFSPQIEPLPVDSDVLGNVADQQTFSQKSAVLLDKPRCALRIVPVVGYEDDHRLHAPRHDEIGELVQQADQVKPNFFCLKRQHILRQTKFTQLFLQFSQIKIVTAQGLEYRNGIWKTGFWLGPEISVERPVGILLETVYIGERRFTGCGLISASAINGLSV
jgi:hypothetical protein